MEWDDLNRSTRDWMAALGEFVPTVVVENREVKGVTYDQEEGGPGTTYWSSNNLRAIARACIEVANWLDERSA